MKKKLLYTLLGLVLIFALGIGYFVSLVLIAPPSPADLSVLELKRTEVSSNFYTLNNNWLKKDQSGLWEMYVEGKPFERGVINGKLAKELVQKQEEHFIAEINKIIPSEWYLSFLKYVVAWFNRELDTYVDREFQLEIYGVSQALGDEYDFIGSKYQRILNYHAAHDIGHALQDKKYVPGCTSFSAWDNRVDDNTLIHGRNFDFYVGDKFAEDKLICFVNPDQGHKFMMVTWGGMIGTVSGMNEKGLTVTINAAKSDMPTKSATPISLVAREILQYAENIEEAIRIAGKRETFVSEAIMVGSWQDNRTAIIEKTPSRIGITISDTDYIVCSNHFQSASFAEDPMNLENIETSDSPSRYTRMNELINSGAPLNEQIAATILRDQKGPGGQDIGMGNQKAINQLIAHHSIIFKPGKQLVWVSTVPWQLGEYVAYDLNTVFNQLPGLKEDSSITVDSLAIAADPFLKSKDYQSFLRYRELKQMIKANVASNEIQKLDKSFIDEFVASNPELYLVYSLLGEYYEKIGDFDNAQQYYNLALSKEIPWRDEAEDIQYRIKSMEEQQEHL